MWDSACAAIPFIHPHTNTHPSTPLALARSRIASRLYSASALPSPFPNCRVSPYAETQSLEERRSARAVVDTRLARPCFCVVVGGWWVVGVLVVRGWVAGGGA